MTGLLGEDRADAVVIRDPGQDGKAVSRSARIRSRSGRTEGPRSCRRVWSNNLGSRQQFLDLVRYLMEIAEKGPARARELKPDPALLAVAPLPESERDIDHAGLISSLDQAELRARGGDLQPRLHQLPRDEGPARLAADITPLCLGRLQERRRPVQHVPHADPRVWPDDPAKLDGAEAEI